MKVLGATRARIAGTFAWEFAFLGLATATAALGVGTLAAYLVVRRLMNLEWTFLPMVAVAVAGGGHGAHPGIRSCRELWRHCGSDRLPCCATSDSNNSRGRVQIGISQSVLAIDSVALRPQITRRRGSAKRGPLGGLKPNGKSELRRL